MRKLYLLLIVFCHIVANAQSDGVETVRRFGESLRLWCSTTDIRYRPVIENMCDEGCRIQDKFVDDFSKKSGLEIKDYVVKNYLNAYESAMDSGTVIVSMSNIRIITSDQQSYSSKKDVRKAEQFSTIGCEIRLGGVLDYDMQSVFYVPKKGNNKILKVTPLREETDNVTGKTKVKVDFSGLDDGNSTLGFTLNYDQHFQTGASVIGQSGLFVCSLDLGFNLDSKKYYSDVMDMTNIMNYERTETEYDPVMFVTVTPGVFFKYVSVGCGVGCAILNTKETVSLSQFTHDDQGNVSGSLGSITPSDASVCKLMFRPQVRGFIPISRSCKMSIGIGYDILPKAKELNGYNVSVGFHFNFDDWHKLWF